MCMGLSPIHSQTGLDLPLAPETGILVLVVALFVCAVIAYDIYRYHWVKEGS